MSNPIILKSFYEVIDQIIEYKKQFKKYPTGSFRLNPQGKIIPDPHGSISIKEHKKEHKKKNKISNVSNLKTSKELICSKCKNKLKASKARIKKLSDAGKLDSYICRSCK